MTTKDFFENASKGILTNDMIIYAQAQMLKYDEANKRNRKVAVADDGVSIDDLRRQILEIVNASDGVLAKDMAKDEGKGGIQLTTHVANLRAQTLYESAGFVCKGVCKNGTELFYLLNFRK